MPTSPGATGAPRSWDGQEGPRPGASGGSSARRHPGPGPPASGAGRMGVCCSSRPGRGHLFREVDAASAVARRLSGPSEGRETGLVAQLRPRAQDSGSRTARERHGPGPGAQSQGTEPAEWPASAAPRDAARRAWRARRADVPTSAQHGGRVRWRGRAALRCVREPRRSCTGPSVNHPLWGRGLESGAGSARGSRTPGSSSAPRHVGVLGRQVGSPWV